MPQYHVTITRKEYFTIEADSADEAATKTPPAMTLKKQETTA